MAWQFLPPSLDLEEASLSLGIPWKTTLQKSGVSSVATGDAAETTLLKLTLGPAVFQVDFTPSLVINLPVPLKNIGLGGIAYDLRSGAITPRLWHEDGVGLPVGLDSAHSQVSAFMRELVTGTSLAIPPYDPAADPELVSAVQQVLANLAGDGGGSVVRSVSLSARLAVLEELASDVGVGGFRIPAGSTITIQVDLEGTPAEVQSAPRLRRAEVTSTSLVLRSGGSDQAELGRIVLTPGCNIEVTAARPLGAAATAAASESLIRLLGALSTQGPAGLKPENIQACVVEGLVKKEIEDALRPALLQWVQENASIASGIDLRTALGVPAPASPPLS